MSNIENYLLVALVGATINLILSSTVPCLLNKTNQPLLEDMKKVFRTNRHAILTSSLIIAVTIFLSLMIVNEGKDMSLFGNTENDVDEQVFIISSDYEIPKKRCGSKGLGNLGDLGDLPMLRKAYTN
jgi:hypothetical protein